MVKTSSSSIKFVVRVISVPPALLLCVTLGGVRTGEQHYAGEKPPIPDLSIAINCLNKSS